MTKALEVAVRFIPTPPALVTSTTPGARNNY